MSNKPQEEKKEPDQVQPQEKELALDFLYPDNHIENKLEDSEISRNLVVF